MSTTELKARIKSVDQTRKITNAMYLLSTSRLKKNMLTTPALQEYLTEIRDAMKKILYYTDLNGYHHKFTEKDTVGRALYLIILGDKGLCGDYNSDVAALAADVLEKDPEAETLVYNLNGESYLKRKGVRVDYALDCSTIHFTEADIRFLSNSLIDMYMTDYFNEIYVIYTPYSRANRKPVCMKMLPLKTEDFIDASATDAPQDMLFAPSLKNIFRDLVPEYFMGVMYDVMLQANAAENVARMDAMQSATDNADDMIDELSSKMNIERQLGITNELTEITAAEL